MPDLQKQAAEMPYHVDPISPRECDETCPCDMTNLRWLLLWRPCPDLESELGGWASLEQHKLLDEGNCKTCNSLGRVPDVTLIKVLNLLPSGWKLEESDFGYAVTSCGKEYHNAIPEDAACAALLEIKDNYFSP